MLDTICEPQERNDILYQWKNDPHLLERNQFIGDLYNDFQTNKNTETFVKTLVANYILEGIYFYSGFMFFYNLGRNHRMPGSVQEIRWGHYVIGDEIQGLKKEMVEEYIRYLGNLRCQNLGFEPIYPGSETEPESMSWVSQFSNANMIKTDFFEAKSTAYAKSSALVDDL